MMTRGVAGHMSNKFDYQMLFRFSIRHGVKVPTYLQPKGRYLPKIYFDTNEMYGGGEFGYLIKLETLAKILGYRGINKMGRSGKDFWKFSQDEKEEYLSADLDMTSHCFNTLNDSLDYCEDAVIYDIETKPRTAEEIEQLIPDFDPAKVKLGNLKDPYKVEEKIKSAEDNHLKSYMDKAQLTAEHCELSAIGYIMPDGEKRLVFCDTDKDIKVALEDFWSMCGSVWGHDTQYFNQ